MSESGMPTTYETTTTTTSSAIGFYPEYIRTIPGILKIVEIVVGLIVIICAAVADSAWVYFPGVGWVIFVSVSALITTLILFVFHLTNIINRIPGPMNLIVLDLIVFICATVWLPFVWHLGGGWVQFVSMGALITTLVLGIMYITHIIYRVPTWYILVEFIYYCVFTVLYLIAAIVCAVRGAYHSSIAASAFFAFAATAVYAVDTFLQFRQWRSTTAGTTTTTTTTTQSNVTVTTEK